MPTLTLTRGLPGSGKTTWARAQVGHVRVNRDDLRRMLHGGMLGLGWAEAQISLAQRALISSLLRGGVNVICDDTNLSPKVVRELGELALANDATLIIEDFTHVSLDDCIARDAQRCDPEMVGEQVIRAMWQRYLAGRTIPLPVPRLAPAPSGHLYRPPAGAPSAVVVDLDGTLAIMNGRNPYDESRVGEDEPNHGVIEAVRAMRAAGHRIVYCSGRTEDSRPETEAWLARHVGVEHDGLHLRVVGDHRPDTIVKAEIFERRIRHHYRVIGVFDDRAQVVRMWRGLGLTVFQVAEGAF